MTQTELVGINTKEENRDNTMSSLNERNPKMEVIWRPSRTKEST